MLHSWLYYDYNQVLHIRQVYISILPKETNAKLLLNKKY